MSNETGVDSVENRERESASIAECEQNQDQQTANHQAERNGTEHEVHQLRVLNCESLSEVERYSERY